MANLIFDTYGKTGVRLTYVDRRAPEHIVRELAVRIFFEGDFKETYLTGDNRHVLPTDTMKNTVYVVARQTSWNSIESLAEALAEHFLNGKGKPRQVSIEIDETPWMRLGEHPAAFVQAGNERRTVKLAATRQGLELTSGLKNLQILKTAKSSFEGFLKDSCTTLPETRDRLLGTVLDAEWRYRRTGRDNDDLFNPIREELLKEFAYHNSLSVQQTLYAMAEAVLARFDTVEEIRVTMPNKHCLLVDLNRFGLDNPNMIFVPTDEPSGYIEARVAR